MCHKAKEDSHNLVIKPGSNKTEQNGLMNLLCS